MAYRTYGVCEHCGAALTAPASARPLTRQQAAIYRFLVSHIHEHGFAPSFEEIAVQFGFASLATVHEHLSNLAAKRVIRREYGESRGITCLVPVDELGGAAS